MVALVASLSTSAAGLLSPEQAQTLFHEFGHALHSLLSRTEFQHHFGGVLLSQHCMTPQAHAQCFICFVLVSVQAWSLVMKRLKRTAVRMGQPCRSNTAMAEQACCPSIVRENDLHALATGTRGPMDLMEVPSHVIEGFARAPTMLCAFAKHHVSGQPMPGALAQQLQRFQGLFGAITLQQQAAFLCFPVALLA